MSLKPKILITGGAGFIGSYLTDKCLKEGWQVRILDKLIERTHPQGKPKYLDPRIEFIQGDVSDRETLKKALEGVDFVAHLAAYMDYTPDFSVFIKTNVLSTALILEIINEQKLPVKKVIVASSQAVHGEGRYECSKCGTFLGSRSDDQLKYGQWEITCKKCGGVAKSLKLEEKDIAPLNQYALSKYFEELEALRIGQLYGIPTTALRYSIVQGPRQSVWSRYSGILRLFATAMLNNHDPMIFEDGNQTRDYVHVSDVVEANWLALNDARTNWQAYNVGSGQGIGVNEYAKKLAEKIGGSAYPKITGEYRVGDNRHSVSSIEKLCALGWTPKKTLSDIFDDYLAWLKTLEEIPYEEKTDKMLREGGIIKKIQNS